MRTTRPRLQRWVIASMLIGVIVESGVVLARPQQAASPANTRADRLLT